MPMLCNLHSSGLDATPRRNLFDFLAIAPAVMGAGGVRWAEGPQFAAKPGQPIAERAASPRKHARGPSALSDTYRIVVKRGAVAANKLAGPFSPTA